MKSKITLITLLIMTLVIAVNLYTESVVAEGNYQDTPYYFEYNGDGSEVVTAARLKKDYSSSYAKNTSDHCSHQISVFATNNSNNTPFIQTDSCPNLTVGANYYVVTKGQARYLPNYVKERGFKYAYLVISPQLHDACVVKGLWSPDSI